IIALSKVTGINELALSQMVGRQLPFFSFLVPFWVVWAMAGFRGMLGVWPAALTAGLAFAIPQFIISNFHGPWLVDIVASICSIVATVGLLKFWRPKEQWKHEVIDATDTSNQPQAEAEHEDSRGSVEREEQQPLHSQAKVRAAWIPWILLSLLV